MTSKTTGVFIAACIALSTGACHKTGTKEMNQADRNFLEQMAFANNAETDEGTTAQARGEDLTIKEFGKEMVAAHNEAMNELKSLAQQRNYYLPTTSDLEHIALETKLHNTTGRNFDSLYIKTMVYDHLQIMGLLQAEIRDGNDDGLKTYANKYLPIAEMHKNMAIEIIAAMNIK
jgi:putative membrane protein